ncbi:nose resistant to fluoxetine protein 6 [Bombyx mori]|uniref:Acyltransferase 3 domain-containing protein n=1 Tax=Bombyx mori TaxID=7091 RepID=A0A8R2M2Y2_BOMMO|nr:nose resistant to fluoxetine protein 6 [Bombyx mori]
MNNYNAFCVCWCVLFGIVMSASEFTDEEYYHLPDLYHLDDYTKCLSQKQGLYCLGTFELSPAEEQSPVFDLIKVYSENPHHFNRTIIQRGWCVSSRSLRTEAEPVRRFTKCGQDWARSRGMNARLLKLEYCRTHDEAKTPNASDLPERVFLCAIICILIFNVIGTAYDLWKGNEENKNKILMAWSMPSNWSRLTSSLSNEDPRLSCLAPFQGARVIVMTLVLWGHVFFSHALVYLQNPRDYEKSLHGVIGALVYNGTSIVQMFVIFSNFLCAYNLLLPSNKKPLTLSMFPKQIVKRYSRITPMNLLLVGYGATWWVHSRDGALWPVLVGNEKIFCEQKFWSHALYINNFYMPENVCFIQTWFLAVDMQLHILALILTLCLAKHRRHALRILGSLFVLSCAGLSLMVYLNNYSTLLQIAEPDNARTMLRNKPSFYEMYVNPFNSLPACLMGLFLAHLLYELQENGYKFHECKWLKYSHALMIPLYILWLFCGIYFRELKSNIDTALFIGLDRLLFCSIFAVKLMGFTTIQSRARKFFSWRGWDVFARMSLSVMMIHWVVNVTIVAARPTRTFTSFIDVSIDAAATIVFTYIMAAPATILVEMPMQRFLDNFTR